MFSYQVIRSTETTAGFCSVSEMKDELVTRIVVIVGHTDYDVLEELSAPVFRKLRAEGSGGRRYVSNCLLGCAGHYPKISL